MPEGPTPGTVDLQNAGVQATPMDDPSALLKALSMGRQDNPLFQGSPLQQAQQNPDMANWSGLAGFGFGLMGQQGNPVVSQVMAAQQQDMRSRLATAGVMRSVMELRRQKQMDQTSMAKDLLAMSNPDARMMGAKLLSGQLKGQGVDIPPESLASQDLSLDKRKAAYMAIIAGQQSGEPVTDDYLERGLGVPKYHLRQLRMEAGSEPVHKMLYGRSPQQDQLDLIKADMQQKDYELKARKEDRYDAAQAFREAKDDKIRAENAVKLDQMERRTKVAEDMANLAHQKFEFAQVNGPKEKQAKALDHAEWFALKIKEYGNKLNAQGFLYPDQKSALGGVLSGDPRALMVKTKRQLDSKNTDWVMFTEHLQGEMVGYARSVQNDIGPRAMQAFQGSFNIMKDPPTLEALNTISNAMLQAIKLGREGKDTAQNLVIRRPDGSTVLVPWKRGMSYDPGDTILRIE